MLASSAKGKILSSFEWLIICPCEETKICWSFDHCSVNDAIHWDFAGPVIWMPLVHVLLATRLLERRQGVDVTEWFWTMCCETSLAQWSGCFCSCVLPVYQREGRASMWLNGFERCVVHSLWGANHGFCIGRLREGVVSMVYRDHAERVLSLIILYRKCCYRISVYMFCFF
jgi:hypothetical protein